MELDHATIRILAAIERERDYPAEEEEWQGSSPMDRHDYPPHFTPLLTD